MSDLDKDNYKQEKRNQKTPLNPATNNVSADMERTGEATPNPRKKKIIYGIIGFVVLVGIILAIVLPLTLKKKDNPPGPDPSPTPAPIPFNYPEYNPYEVDDSQTTATVFKAQYIIKDPTYNKTKNAQRSLNEKRAKAFMKLSDSGASYTPVNPQDIPILQDNNVGTDTIQMNLDMVNNFNVRILVQDFSNLGDNKPVADTVFSRPVFEHEARLSQINFTQSSSPF